MQFRYQTSSLLKNDQFEQTATTLIPYITHIQDVVEKKNYDAPESSINLPTDQNLLNEVQQMNTQKVTPKLKYFIDIGIGGSNLGTKAVYDALFGYNDLLQPERFPKMIFLDTNDEEVLAKTIKLLQTLTNKEEIFINTISKSGGTTETIANLEIVLQTLKDKFGDIADRVVITTEKDSKFYNLAQKKGFPLVTLPKQVGGRYSVLSAVGLFPLACCGFDIQSLREGAEKMRTQCISQNLSDNPAVLSASILYLHYKNGKNINDNFFFLPQLESLGKWYRQLMGESVGKEHDLQGNIVHVGLTPTVSIGSTDLHSVGQLYLGGPRDKITTFVWGENKKQEALIPKTLEFPLVDGIAGKSTHTIMKAICDGVKIAYKNQGLPFMEVVFDKVNEKEIGEYMQFKMIEMMYLGKLLNVNPFDQPHVELYKVETKKILNQ